MTYKKFAKLRRELCRRIWLQQKGSLKGFGKSDRAMRGKHPDFSAVQSVLGSEVVASYDAIWNSKPFKSLRESVGM